MKTLPIIIIAAVVAVGIGIVVVSFSTPGSELDRMLAAEDCDAMQYVIDHGLQMELTDEHERKLELLWLKCASGSAANP